MKTGNQPPIPDPAGNVELLILRVLKNIARKFEIETGISQVWETIAPTVTAIIQGPQKGARRK